MSKQHPAARTGGNSQELPDALPANEPFLGTGRAWQDRNVPTLCSGFGARRPGIPQNQFAPQVEHPASGKSILCATGTLLAVSEVADE